MKEELKVNDLELIESNYENHVMMEFDLMEFELMDVMVKPLFGLLLLLLLLFVDLLLQPWKTKVFF